MDQYDLAIIGAGPAGYVAALYARPFAKRIILIEKDRVGGTCLHRGCIPTKTLLHTARLYASLAAVRHDGLIFSQAPRLDHEQLYRHKDGIVDRMCANLTTLLFSGGVLLRTGTARFVNAHELDIDGDRIGADRILIATGSVPITLAQVPVDGKRVLTSDDLLRTPIVPAKLIIIGGGVIGCECAALYRMFGAQVTIVEMADQLLPGMDREVALTLQRAFVKRGIEVLTGAAIMQAQPEGAGVVCVTANQRLTADRVLLAVGRRPNGASLNSADIGIAGSAKGITVDEFLRTNIPMVYAAGDVTGRTMLAHVAWYQAECAVEHMFGKGVPADYRAVPSCVYTDPEVASVGMSAADAAVAGYAVTQTKYPYAGIGRAVLEEKTEGFVKIVSDTRTGTVLGMQVIGAQAASLIPEATLAVQGGVTVETLARTIHAHPTIAEGIAEAAHLASGRPVHALFRNGRGGGEFSS